MASCFTHYRGCGKCYIPFRGISRSYSTSNELCIWFWAFLGFALICGSLLHTRCTLNPSINEWLHVHPLLRVLSHISMAQPLKFGNGSVISSHIYWACGYLFMLGSKLIHAYKSVPRYPPILLKCSRLTSLALGLSCNCFSASKVNTELLFTKKIPYFWYSESGRHRFTMGMLIAITRRLFSEWSSRSIQFIVSRRHKLHNRRLDEVLKKIAA